MTMPSFPRMLLAAGLMAGATLAAHADDALDAAKAQLLCQLCQANRSAVDGFAVAPEEFAFPGGDSTGCRGGLGAIAKWLRSNLFHPGFLRALGGQSSIGAVREIDGASPRLNSFYDE
jgi:hypothetical protein